MPFNAAFVRRQGGSLFRLPGLAQNALAADAARTTLRCIRPKPAARPCRVHSGRSTAAWRLVPHHDVAAAQSLLVTIETSLRLMRAHLRETERIYRCLVHGANAGVHFFVTENSGAQY